MGIHKGDMGLWEYHGDRGKAYRKVWSQGTGKRREKESHPGRDCQTESVETREECKKTDQVELLFGRLLDDSHIQEIQAVQQAGLQHESSMEIEEIKACIDAGDTIGEILERHLEEIDQDITIKTSAESGIKHREKILGIQPLDTASLEDRRLEVLLRWWSSPVYTETTLRQKLDAVLGRENYILDIELDKKQVSCQVEVTRKYMIKGVEDLFEQMVPLDYLLEIILRYNQYKKYKPYDLAVSAAKDWMNKGNYMGSKITIAPANVMHTYDAIVHMFELGYCEINANCVYEDGWKPIHATVLYNEMKRLADYILENNMDFENDYYCSLFEEEFFHPKLSSDLENWCGGNGVMLAVDPAGIIYPCLRYMESSLGNQQEPYSIGDVDHGICQTECDRCRVERLKKIDRRTQSTDECFNCPIAEGCSWCTAYNYQIFGTPDARATYICIMHKARALANAYFWNRYYKKNKINKRMKLYIPKEWALNIITEKEWNLLKREAEEG